METSSINWNDLINTRIISNIPKLQYTSKIPNYKHKYSMESMRVSRLDLQVYSIDPEGCTDADDAFSIWEDDNIVHLMIHIADPTCYFEPTEEDEYFKCVYNNITSWYPSGNPTRHMFSDNLVEYCTLTHGIRNTITVYLQFKRNTDDTSSFTILNSSIHYFIIDCDNQKRFTYENAGKALSTDTTLQLGDEIRHFLYKQRSSGNSFIEKAQEELKYDNVYVKLTDEIVIYRDEDNTRKMKYMIQEFAIIGNSVIARELVNKTSYLLRSFTITPTNNSTEEHSLLATILKSSGASYTNEKQQHDLIGNDMYTHFTSPLRRFSDCIVHFMLKDYSIGDDCVFSKEQLIKMSDRCNTVSKCAKKLSFEDKKLRYLQYINQQIDSGNEITITYKPYAYNGLFINILIHKINDWNVYFTYSLRRKHKNITLNDDKCMKISSIKIPSKFDEGTLPELDAMFT